MKTYIKPAIQICNIINYCSLLSTSTIGIYGDDYPVKNDDTDYVEGAKPNYNTWSNNNALDNE